MSYFDRILNAGYTIKIQKLLLEYEISIDDDIDVIYFHGKTIEEATKLCVEYLGV